MSTVQNTFIFYITEAALLEEFGLMHHLGNYGGGAACPCNWYSGLLGKLTYVTGTTFSKLHK